MNNRRLQRVIDGCSLLAQADVASLYSVMSIFIASATSVCIILKILLHISCNR